MRTRPRDDYHLLSYPELGAYSAESRFKNQSKYVEDMMTEAFVAEYTSARKFHWASGPRPGGAYDHSAQTVTEY